MFNESRGPQVRVAWPPVRWCFDGAGAVCTYGMDLVEEFRSLDGVEGGAIDGSGHESIGERNQNVNQINSSKVWHTSVVLLVSC